MPYEPPPPPPPVIIPWVGLVLLACALVWLGYLAARAAATRQAGRPPSAVAADHDSRDSEGKQP